ncbi:2-dehydro-3-deoxygalactonokinase [Allomesorhizobium camelthorni]|uniref:2-dehydro-3-deoxygalactonokinase n=1 Tax=Allomesorhizobium camelthorni TaxID=475069 RepID=A0A6G4WAA1_9HYPH|nr:2-dehydro-3-deoxygalactonokinase [Mesorhizobium camelthorni]
MSARVVAVDWGTSRLRIWLLDQDGSVLAERRSDEGMLAARPDGFGRILEGHLDALGAPVDLPAIICGMAGSRQGWVEAPYVAVPASMQGIFAGAAPIPGSRRDIRILPGVAQRDPASPDVMRGEETQLAGIASLLGSDSHIVCMPGTHSKWVEIADGSIAGFATYMTGELFSVLAGHSILSHSLGAESHAVSATDPLFRRWCQDSLSDPGDVSARLFRIRASTLLLDLKPGQAAAALSGLLIGAEVASASRRFAKSGAPVVLVASGALRPLYEAAFGLAGLEFHPVEADEAVRAGLFAAARHLGMGEPAGATA